MSRCGMVMRANVADEARASRVERERVALPAAAAAARASAAGRENARRGGIAYRQLRREFHGGRTC